MSEDLRLRLIASETMRYTGGFHLLKDGACVMKFLTFPTHICYLTTRLCCWSFA